MSGGDGTGVIILLVICLGLYFMPSIIASGRGKANGATGVIIVNLLLGWTVVGWFVAFIWACSGETRGEIAKRDRQHRELMKALAAKK